MNDLQAIPALRERLHASAQRKLIQSVRINGSPFAHTFVKRLLMSLVVVLNALSCHADSSPVEAGKVTWGRDLNEALALSRQSGKPVFALFQEIPGCAGCRQFGKDVLSNPWLVEAIETEFTPLLIHNNKQGKDAEVLKRFGEPAWNFQVVRFLDAEANDVIARRDHIWDTKGIADRMVATLEKVKRLVPAYLRLLASEHSPILQSAVFSMSCFWSGEVTLGMMNGVVTTQAGFSGGREVVLARFDPSLISLPELTAGAERNGGHYVKSAGDYRAAPDQDQKKQLEGTTLSKLELSAAQATKVNAWRTVDMNQALAFLTPSQRARLK